MASGTQNKCGSNASVEKKRERETEEEKEVLYSPFTVVGRGESNALKRWGSTRLGNF